MKKRLISILLVAAACLMFAACQQVEEKPAIIVKSQGGTYEILGVLLDDEYAGNASAAGERFLLITLEGKQANMEDMANTFMGVGAPCTISAGSTTIECSQIAYGTKTQGDSPDVMATLVFIVQEGFPKNFSLAANDAKPVSLEYTVKPEPSENPAK